MPRPLTLRADSNAHRSRVGHNLIFYAILQRCEIWHFLTSLENWSKFLWRKKMTHVS